MRDDAVYCIQFAATRDATPELVAEAKQRTHDICIELAGEYRRSGVTWRVLGAERGIEFLNYAIDTEAFDPTSRDFEILLQLRNWLREFPKGRLIMASCEIDGEAPPPDPAKLATFDWQVIR